MTEPVEFIDLGGGQSVDIGGVTVRGETSNTQSSGQQVPTKSAENGYVYTTRVGPTATEGTIVGWVNSSELPALVALADEKSPIPISTPEGTYSQCVVDDIKRNMAGIQPDAYEVTITWREVLQASTATSRVRAITDEGAKNAAAGGPNDGLQGRASTARVGKETVANGPDVGEGARKGAEDGDGALDGIAEAVTDWL